MTNPNVWRWRTLATLLLVGVLAIPALTGGDGVPLSSYPMYARARPNVIEFIVPVGLDANEVERSLSTAAIASTRDPLIAESFLRAEVIAGRVDALCEQIALRVDDDSIVAVEIRSERHRVIDQALGEESLIERHVLARCETRPS